VVEKVKKRKMRKTDLDDEEDLEEDVEEKSTTKNSNSKVMLVPRAVSIEDMFNIIDDKIMMLNRKLDKVISELKRN